MPDRDDKKREAPISYRPPSDLREEFRARVERSGLTINAFLNKAVFNLDPPRQSRKPTAAQIESTRDLVKADKISDARRCIRTILTEHPEISAVISNHPEAAAALEEALGNIDTATAQMRSEVMTANGRKP